MYVKQTLSNVIISLQALIQVLVQENNMNTDQSREPELTHLHYNKVWDSNL